MKQNQISELKNRLTILSGNYKCLDIVANTSEDFKELNLLAEEIDSIKCELLELTGDDIYSPNIEAVIKKYRRAYWDFREYGAISLSELYKRKQGKIEIIKRLHKQNGINNLTVNMMNIHRFFVDKKELEVYLKNRKNITKKSNRRETQFDMLLQEIFGYGNYFSCNNRFKELQDIVCQVLGPDKKAMEAKFSDFSKVKKIAKILREQL